MFAAPLSETYGRRIIYLITWYVQLRITFCVDSVSHFVYRFFFTIFQIPVALAPNYACVLVCKLHCLRSLMRYRLTFILQSAFWEALLDQSPSQTQAASSTISLASRRTATPRLCLLSQVSQDLPWAMSSAGFWLKLLDGDGCFGFT
jgi:hypothetical protein